MLYVIFLLYYISLNSGQHPERIKRFSIETYRKSRFGYRRFRLSNVIPERIIFISRGITVSESTDSQTDGLVVAVHRIGHQGHRI